MGTCSSKLHPCLCHMHFNCTALVSGDLENGGREVKDALLRFREFGLEELRAATAGFSPEIIVSEHGEKAPHGVYRGRLLDAAGNIDVAVNRFNKSAWRDCRQFLEEARVVGELQSERLATPCGGVHASLNTSQASLSLGCHSLSSEMRIRMLLHLAQALEHRSSNGRALNHDLNAYRVLFDELNLWVG